MKGVRSPPGSKHRLMQIYDKCGIFSSHVFHFCSNSSGSLSYQSKTSLQSRCIILGIKKTCDMNPNGSKEEAAVERMVLFVTVPAFCRCCKLTLNTSNIRVGRDFLKINLRAHFPVLSQRQPNLSTTTCVVGSHLL